MSKLFGNMTTDGMEKTEDRLGGGRQVFESDIYTGQIKMLYALESSGGAKGVFLELDIDGKSYTETIYITSGTAKGQKNYYEKDGKKIPMPGFVTVDDIAQCAIGKSLSELAFEEKIVKIYDFETKKEEPKSVPVATELLGKTISVAIQKTKEDKTKKDGNDYVPTGETVDRNNIQKVFHTESRSTTVEAREGKEAGGFWDAWVEKNKGNVYDKSSGAQGQAGKPGGNAGGPPQAGSSAPKKSLFG